jgi:cell wall-associated NlpC family hydrolase
MSEICKGHVYYFEPNDADEMGKDQDGQDVTLMPHLEDMCISMTLTADMYSRKRTQTTPSSEHGPIKSRSISWISYVNGVDNLNLNQQVLNAGEDLGGQKYLTTYYSEISADNYVENELIEGLGVTSVNIAYESWYTPTITMNFVDVHGSALWGREEAIHDEEGNITSDTLLGVFFQQPYPLFRLQVKGFLGREVTYQLSVSGFKGRYNSQTGNFEATATFIGYSYSLLTDVPLKMLSYVSEMTYVGKEYWDDKCGTKEWEMINADGTRTEPVKLYQFIQNVRSAISAVKQEEVYNCDATPTQTTKAAEKKDKTSEDNVVTIHEEKNLRQTNNATKDIDAIETALNDLIKECESFAENTMGGTSIIGEAWAHNNHVKTEQLLLMITKPVQANSGALDQVFRAYRTFSGTVIRYNDKNPKKPFVNACETFFSPLFKPTKNPEVTENLQNGFAKLKRQRIIAAERQDTKLGKQIIKFGKGARKNGTYGNVVAEYDQLLSEVKINDQSLYTNTRTQLEALREEYKTTGVPFGEYAILIPLGQMRSDIASIKKRITNIATNTHNRTESQISGKSNSNEKVGDGISENQEDEIKKKIIDIVGFEPTIGNFVKMVMCHLETFVEVMMNCADHIYIDRERRTCENFNISLDDTDIPYGNKGDNGDGFIYPWPALYNPSPKTNSETTKNKGQYEMLGWTNDYKPKKGGLEWEEQKVVLSAIDAIKRCDEKTKLAGMGVSYKYACLPLSGADLSNRSPFSIVGTYCKKIETLAPTLGLRIAHLIGVANNQCSAADAEMIGYLDALNLFAVSSNLEKLHDGIGDSSKFVDTVKNYLTCETSSQTTTQTEQGVQFNTFEFNKQSIYNDNGRHPMYCKQKDGRYKYTYIYTKPFDDDTSTSIVPTSIFHFTGKNSPYINRLIKPNIFNNKTYYEPYIHQTGNTTGKSQHYIYLPTTTDVIVLPQITAIVYTNEQLFTVITNSVAVSTLETQLSDLKEGKVKFSDYEVEKNTDTNDFIDKLFKFSKKDYGTIFCGKTNYNVLIPLISKADEAYYKDHLCKSEDDVDTVTFDNTWFEGDKLYKNLKLSVDGDEFKNFKNGKTTYATTDVMIGDLLMNGSTGQLCSLFGNTIYYSQNNITDETLRNKAKAYLLLNAMMAGVDVSINKFTNGIFRTNNKNIIDYLPPFYVLFLGALLWRQTQENDPINFEYDTNFNAHDKRYSLINKVNKILSTHTNLSQTSYTTIADYYIKFDYIDVSVKNKLIREFESFANGTDFKTINQNCELTNTEGNTLSLQEWQDLKKKFSDSNFDSSKPSQWKDLFGNFWTKYSAIIKTPSCGLRLLISENNPAKATLRKIYGLDGGWIVGRGTTMHVGQSKTREVVVSDQQFSGYLTGFQKRIDEVFNKLTTVKKESAAPTTKDIDRDIAVSLYYTLKHLWDSWLISAPRDQFTIQNFFNKYFIFIDSFYVNTYNAIKLNCEVITDAYDTDNANLLTFITTVTSKERCMFFALPTFMDSNLLGGASSTVSAYNQRDNLAYNKDNLKSIFKPYSFNEIGAPSPNNIFVFVYTQPYSANAAENTDKKFDSYMMNDQTSWPGQLNVGLFDSKDAPEIGTMYAHPNNGQSDDNDELISARYAYMMPCFGISVNRGNNVIFKSINVNMDSPQITSVAAQTYENILTKYGKDGAKRVFFHGQDIFNVYSQYAYSCEVEMIGCAQIQPLMYFQLLNIPMWRGTYMIYKVSHTMEPGKMSTKFVGMKMSRTQAPFATGYYSISKEGKWNPQQSNTGNGSAASQGASNYDIVTYAKSFLDEGRTDGSYGYCGDGCNEQRLHDPIKSGDKTDCSGFVWSVFKHVLGKDIGNTAVGQIDYAKKQDAGTKKILIWNHLTEDTQASNAGKPSVDILSPGDIVWTTGPVGKGKNKYGVQHASIYIGDEKVIGWGNSNKSDNPSIANLNANCIAVARYTGTTVTTELEAQSNNNTPASGGGNSTQNSKSNNNKDGIYVIGDSWALGVGPYFQYHYGLSGKSLKDVTTSHMIADLWAFDVKSIVVVCGLNDCVSLAGRQAFSNALNAFISLAKLNGKRCYICQFPRLNYPCGWHDQITENNVNDLNKRIGIECLNSNFTAHSIKIPDSVSQNNLQKDGYHLIDYGRLAQVIRQNLPQ